LKAQKDPLTFVEVADQVTRKMDGVHFLLAGDGVLAEEVRKRVAKMKHPDRFHSLGWVRNTAQLLAQLDLVVLTSLWEGVPRVIPESTIAGVPVIASDIDGNREVIFPGRNGALAEPRNAESFTSRVIDALESSEKVDPKLTEEFKREFDIDQMVRLQEELYCNLTSYVAV
jgi:glycosyltransferase involved in cell wall biosynthesis